MGGGDMGGRGTFDFRLLCVLWSGNPMVVLDSSGCFGFWVVPRQTLFHIAILTPLMAIADSG